MNWLGSNWVWAALILGTFAFLMLRRRRHAPVSGCGGGHAHRPMAQNNDTTAQALAGNGASGPAQQPGGPRHDHGPPPRRARLQDRLGLPATPTRTLPGRRRVGIAADRRQANHSAPARAAAEDQEASRWPASVGGGSDRAHARHLHGGDRLRVAARNHKWPDAQSSLVSGAD